MIQAEVNTFLELPGTLEAEGHLRLDCDSVAHGGILYCTLLKEFWERRVALQKSTVTSDQSSERALLVECLWQRAYDLGDGRYSSGALSSCRALFRYFHLPDPCTKAQMEEATR